VDVFRPPAVGDASAIKALRTVVFVGIEAAAVVYPKGYWRKHLTPALWGLGPLLTIHTTDPLPDTRIYVAVTPEELRIFGKPMFSSPFEIGRWKKGSYRASIPESGMFLRLDLELAKLGRIRLNAGLSSFSGRARQVFDLIVQSAAGPVSSV